MRAASPMDAMYCSARHEHAWLLRAENISFVEIGRVADLLWMEVKNRAFYGISISINGQHKNASSARRSRDNITCASDKKDSK